jgi:competence protein ComEC
MDHINGIPEVIEHCKLGSIYANDDFFDKANQWGTAKFLNDCLVQIGIKMQPVGKDLNLSGGADIKILWPIEQIFQHEELGDNDKSLVSLIEFAGIEILLCSDIEKFAQRELLRLHPDLKADIVVAPHHGSVNTLEDDFLEKLDADILIYSCGRTQYERQQQMIKGKGNAKSFYTPEHGAVAVSISRDGMIKTIAFAP